MKHLSFVQPGHPPGAGEALDCLVLDGRNEADTDWITTETGVDDTAKNLVCTAPTRNGRTQVGSSIILSLVRTDVANNSAPAGVNVLIEATRLMVVCYDSGLLVEDALARYAEHGGRGGASRLLPIIVAALVRPLEAEIARLSDTIDDLDEQAMSEGDESLGDSVVRVARRVLALRRYLVPMRDELSFLALNPDELPGVIEPRDFRRAAEYPGRLISALDSSHQRVTLILDQLAKRSDGRLARSMHKLTIVGTVFLPLSFITGLLGINVAGIPDSHNPLGFWLVCAFLLLVAIGAIGLIRWRKWV